MTLKCEGQGQILQKPWKSPFELYVETSGGKMFHEEIPIGGIVSDITNDVPFLRHVTSNIYFFGNYFFKASM